MTSAEDPSKVISLRMRLKEATAAQHEDIERDLGIMDPALSAARYERILEAFYLFYQPLENRLRVLEDTCAICAEYGVSRSKTPLLEGDLGADKVRSLREELGAGEFDWLKASAQVLGVLYVIEGSTLGGQVIQTHLASLDIPRRRFFSGYGAETGRRWREFLRHLEMVPESDHGAVVEAARETFTRLSARLSARVGAIR